MPVMVANPSSLPTEPICQRGWVPPRLPSLLEPPIGFAHRGASAHAKANTVEAFALALRLGATGLETDAWLTADGEVVLDHDGVVRQGIRKRPIAELPHSDLPPSIPTLGDLYAACGVDTPLSIDVKPEQSASAAAIVQVARVHGASLDRLYLCGTDREVVAGWTELGVRAVHSTRLRKMTGGPERHMATLADAGVAVVNMPYPDWNGGLTTLCHRFGLLAFAWDAQHARQLDQLLDMGVDAVYSDHADRLADALARLMGTS
jgi:glycerophosphoryl diester phosphodiesterase